MGHYDNSEERLNREYTVQGSNLLSTTAWFPALPGEGASAKWKTHAKSSGSQNTAGWAEIWVPV